MMILAGEFLPVGRRRFSRMTVLLTGRLHRGPRAVDCLVANLSANGARILAAEPLDGEMLAALHIHRYGMFPGEVVWRDQGGAGIRFLDAPDAIAAAMRPTLRPERMGDTKSV